MTKQLFSYVKLSVWCLLAMTCISCAHQAKEASLMIDTDTPTEEHVWSETREVQQTIAAEEKSEEEQLAEVEKEEENTSASVSSPQAQTEESLSESAEKKDQELASADSGLSSNNTVETQPESALASSSQIAKNDEGMLKPEENNAPPTEESKLPSREISSEVPMEEVTPPSRVEPTIGVPARLKSEESPPPRKLSPRSKKLLMNETTVAKMVAPKAAEKPVMVKEPTVDIVPKETNIVSQEKQEVPQMNELGEEQDSSTQLASVEIANFVQNHWLAILLVGGVFVVGLFFFMRRKREEDNQQPI